MSMIQRKKKQSKAYRPDTRVLERLEKIWLTLRRGFLLIRQLLCNFRGQGTVGYTRAVLSANRDGKPAASVCAKSNTHWYLHRSDTQTQRRQPEWLVTRVREEKMQERVHA